MMEITRSIGRGEQCEESVKCNRDVSGVSKND